ncbi:16S rRNA (cytidine(1402)-2'-O)-methyltransferase [Candidatus Kaiserbacteria bacterium]|nr:16S rRNA (cytidine(1402)-2'-O)-methyltransferase [Candidatus Kaiserbacteria bacterium]
MGKLSIVATPIGNLEDITLRAIRTLKECDVVYAEDTRVVSKLLAKYEIRKPLQRLDAAKESEKTDEVIARLEQGENVAYVSDAGTPGISDPGSWLVACVRAAGFPVEVIPGPSSLTAALSIAGVPLDEFTFLGFLPHKKGRQTALKEIAAHTHPVVLFESPHRILKLLKELETHASQKKVTIARELTKIHEEVVSGTAKEIARSLESRGADRGEFVVIIHE